MSCSLVPSQSTQEAEDVLESCWELWRQWHSLGHKPSLSLVYISSCFAGDNGENDSLTRDLPNNDGVAGLAGLAGPLLTIHLEHQERLPNAGPVGDSREVLATAAMQLYYIRLIEFQYEKYKSS